MAWMDSEGKLHDDGVFPELKDRAVEKPDAHSVLSEVPSLSDETIQELREIILDSGSSRRYQNMQIRDWFARHLRQRGSYTKCRQAFPKGQATAQRVTAVIRWTAKGDKYVLFKNR